MSQLLPPRCIQDTDAILEEYKILRSIYTGIEKIMAKGVFEEIFKRQNLYYNRFIEDIEQICENLQRNLTQDQLALFEEVQAI